MAGIAEMTTRERFHAVMNFRPFDRLPIVEWAGWWDKTIARWQGEGLTGSDRYEIARQFGMDIYRQDWVWPHRPGCPTAPSHGAPIITNMDEYDRLVPYLYPEFESGEQWAAWAKLQASGDEVLWFTMDGFFWFPRKLLGIEPHLFAFYDQPELMHRINRDLCDWMIRMIDAICEICTPDFMTFGEDLSYNHGPMISQQQFEEFIRPYYDRVIPRLRQRGIMAIVDSDGDVTVPAYWFEQAGLDGILPLERQAGVDIVRLRREHPRMRFIGHFDKMTMNRGEAAMRAEFERLLPTAARGGFLISCDHQTPPGVSLEEYRLYLSLFNEYARKAGQMSQGLA